VNPVWIEGALLLALVYVTARPLGAYVESVFEGRATFASRLLGPVARAIYRTCRIDETREMRWTGYASALIAFSFASIVATYAALRLQAFLPLNPQHFGAVAPDLAWNTAVSFATTTDWQFYSGESTMSYGSQMAILAWQNFVAAGTGLAVAVALFRGLARGDTRTIGNFWVDLTRGILYVLLPLAVLFGLAFAMQGVPQNLHAISTSPRATAPCSPSRADRWRRRRASSCSAETAAASWRRTRRVRTKIRRRTPISCSCSRCCSCPPRSRSRSGGWCRIVVRVTHCFGR